LSATCLASQAAPVETPSLSSMPEIGRIWMGMEEGSVRPASYQQVRAEAEGLIELFRKDMEQLKRGTHWATVDPRQLEIEEQTIAVEELKAKHMSRKAEEDAESTRVRGLLEIREMETKARELESLAKSDEFPEAIRKRSASALSELQSRIKTMKERVDPAEIEEQLRAEKQEADLQIARKRKQLELIRRRSLLTAENDGELRFSENLREKIKNAAEDGSGIWIKTGEHIATIVDDTSIEMVVPTAGPVMGQIPQEELAVFLLDGKTGKLIEGRFNRMDEVDSGVEITRNYIFDIPPESIEAARQAMGHRHMVHVYRKFPRNYRLVHKKNIAFLAPQILETSGWHGLASHLWPGCKVIQVGPQTIAIDPGDAN
jgi:hypothetical protein